MVPQAIPLVNTSGGITGPRWSSVPSSLLPHEDGTVDHHEDPLGIGRCRGFGWLGAPECVANVPRNAAGQLISSFVVNFRPAMSLVRTNALT